MLQKKLPVAESPQYTDARQAAVARRLNIHIAITHIHRNAFLHAKLPQSLNHGIGTRFLPNTPTLADGHFHQITEEMAAQLLRGFTELIAHHSHTGSTLPQTGKQLHDARIRLSCVNPVLEIILAERRQNRINTTLTDT